MPDTDRNYIYPLDNKSYCALWMLRVVAAIRSNRLKETIKLAEANPSKMSSISEAPSGRADTTVLEDKQEQASNIIIHRLGDNALRIVWAVTGKPREMMDKLDKRYDSWWTATRIFTKAELAIVKDSTKWDDVSKPIDHLAAVIKNLRTMGAVFDGVLAIGILVASLDISDLALVTAVVKILGDKDLSWEDSSNRLIEKAKALKSG